MAIHYQGIMVIIPSIVTTIFLGAFWKRFTAPAACISMITGSVFTLLSSADGFERMIDPIANFIGPHNASYKYIRALFGMSVTGVLGVIITFMTQPRKDDEIKGLTIGTLDAGMEQYKGGKPNHVVGEKLRRLKMVFDDSLPVDQIAVSPAVMERLKANQGDMVYIEDSRWYLGGLRSAHTKAAAPHGRGDDVVALARQTAEEAFLIESLPITIEKIF